MKTSFFLTLTVCLLTTGNLLAQEVTQTESVKVVKGQVSDYFIPVHNEYVISGRVLGSEGRPLTNATVMFFASPCHCNTDKNGYYQIKATDSDTHLYIYAPGYGFNHVYRKAGQRQVDITMHKASSTPSLPRTKAKSTPWYDPEHPSNTTYCNPLNISYNYEPFNDNVKRGGCFRSAADPMAVVYKGEYLLFSTNQGGYHYSKNLSDWDFRTATFQRHPIDDDVCAPSAWVSGDTLFYTGSTYEGLPIWYSVNPSAGRWKHAVSRNSLPSWDPCFFQDDDGKLYLYYGSSNEYPLKAVEVSRQNFDPVGSIHDVIMLHPEKYGWERFGMNNDDTTTLRPFTEGAFMTKHNGLYYLQYGAPGTEFKVYADGVYVSKSPLGPFAYQKNNPMSYKPGGFVQGVGHGGTFCDVHGQYWHVGTCMLSLKYKFERRIGLYPTYFDQDGIMWTDTSFGDYPQRNADYEGKDRFTGWMLLSLEKKMSCSSTDTLNVQNLADENMRTYWSAKTGDPGEWIKIDLAHPCDVRAIQCNFYDRGTVQCNRASDTYYQYRIWASDDNVNWKLVVDKSDNDRDVPHDYVELKQPLKTRYLKLENLHMPGGGKFCLSEFRVFGESAGEKPSAPRTFKVIRDRHDPRNAKISWVSEKGSYGYNIYFGIAPDKLYHCITVYGDSSYDLRGLDVGTNYYFSVQSLAEQGCSKLSKQIKI